MNPYIIKAGFAIAAAVAVAAWAAYTRRKYSCYNHGSAPQPSRFDGSELTMCTICHDSLAIFNSSANATLLCKHKFHLNCIKLMNNIVPFKKCPNCRKEVSSDFLADLLKKQTFDNPSFN